MSLQSFIEAWQKAEAAYPEPLDENLRTVWFMQCLNGVMKANVFTQEFPSSFNHLMGLAKKAELAVDAGKDDQKVENLGPDRGSNTKKKRSRPNKSDESRKRRELLCFQCVPKGSGQGRVTRKGATIMDLDAAAKGLVVAAVTRSRKEIADASHPKDYVPDHAEATLARRSSTKEQVQGHHDAGLILGRPTTVHSGPKAIPHILS
ncbi:hypothetical protein E4U56_001863 [Claviceps arundinis]|uniref:Uncharacterized protein n=1 Tax=Claviceps arundinis TaxID=1623583 RepID=A0A9P7SMK1_9HYPO|nr:hypothetical protein E4U56_001863 [Claviceps arundinis]